MIVTRYLYSSLCFLFIFSFVAAQQTAVYQDAEYHYKLGYELYNKEKYSAAISELDKALANKDLSEASRQNAEYYKAASASELFHPDAEFMLVNYLEKNPQSIKAPLAHFQLARIYYKQKRYKNAIDQFEQTDVYYLKNDEVTEYYFKTGYGYFAKKEYDKAGKQFAQIVNIESKYKTAAQYYFAHVAYENNNYKTALEGFEKLKDSETFGNLVPYYIVQIYFEQEKYDELLNYAIPLLEKEKLQNKTEIKRFIAESYFKKGLYDKAIKFFEDYAGNTPQLSREENYQIAYCYYKEGLYEKAGNYFKKTVQVKDQLSQNAYYHLADCFLRQNDRQAARTAFESASKSDFDKEIKEESAFNYAKLTYELNYQAGAIRAFNDFQKNYPLSDHKDEVSEILANIYISTHNYKDALAALENVKEKSASAKIAYQKVAFYRGTEFFNDRNYDKAIGMFNKAITTSGDEKTKVNAIYWKSEALYNQNKFDEAIKEYRIFIFSSASLKLDIYNTANYNIAYCYFKKKNYNEAATWFRKYIQSKAQTDEARYNDALMRIGDSYFVSRDFSSAENYYADAAGVNAVSSDYALFQKGLILGIKGNMKAKAQTMQQVIDKFPKSTYIDDAVFEKGNALLADGEESDAKTYYNRIITNYPQSPYIKKSMLNLGQIYFNQKNDADALRIFKKVIEKYPSTPEAAEALNRIQSVYVSSGNPNAYFEYANSIPSVSISPGAKDSISYEAAYQQFTKGDLANAAKGFAAYLSSFPQGYFSIQATFYKAECDYKSKNYDAALSGYENIIGREKNLFTERSLSRAATIYYSRKDYTKALEAFKNLENLADYKDNILMSHAGQMRCNYYIDKCDDAILNSQKVLLEQTADNTIKNEAHLIFARCALKSDDWQNAQYEYGLLAKQGSSAITAEAKYSLALIQYKLGNYKESQKKCMEVSKQVPGYDYWVAKSFILLADNYAALKDYFQARQTLQSIIDNYERNADDADDIRNIAKQKLDELNKTETETSNKAIMEKLKPAEMDSINEE